MSIQVAFQVSSKHCAASEMLTIHLVICVIRGNQLLLYTTLIVCIQGPKPVSGVSNGKMHLCREIITGRNYCKISFVSVNLFLCGNKDLVFNNLHPSQLLPHLTTNFFPIENV